MAKNTTIANAGAIAACDGVVDRLDAGTGPGKLRIYDAPQPANPDVAVSTQVLLAELTLSDPAFGDAVDADPGGQATANAITDDTSANATGTAAWFRAVDSNDVGVIDGTVGTSDSDLNLNTINIVAGATVSVSSWLVTMPETPA